MSRDPAQYLLVPGDEKPRPKVPPAPKDEVCGFCKKEMSEAEAAKLKTAFAFAVNKFKAAANASPGWQSYFCQKCANLRIAQDIEFSSLACCPLSSVLLGLQPVLRCTGCRKRFHQRCFEFGGDGELGELAGVCDVPFYCHECSTAIVASEDAAKKKKKARK